LVSKDHRGRIGRMIVAGEHAAQQRPPLRRVEEHRDFIARLMALSMAM
jgi:hypothetical protein